MADSRDTHGKNRKFTGTDSIQLPKGTTGERVASGATDKGKIRYNTTTNLSEYYDGNVWKAIDAPPVVNSISPTLVTDPDGSTTTNITLTGTGFSTTTAPTITFRSTVDGTVFTATVVTVNSDTEAVAATLGTMTSAKSPYSVRLTNPSELFGQLDSGLTLDGTQTFDTAAGSIGTVNTNDVNPTLSPVTATDPDGDNITYSITSGALPTGLSLNSSTGAITGTAGTLSSGTASFTIAAATNAQTVSRAFTITTTNILHVAATGGDSIATQGDYKVHTFTSSGTFTVSCAGNGCGSNSVEYLVVAGGGGAGADNGGGGGGGGFRTNYPSPATGGLSVSAQAYPITVGGGGGASNPGNRGSNSVFSSITSTGGGGSPSCNQGNTNGPGGSGSGGAQHGHGGGSGNTPPVSPPQGNPGHPGSPNPGGGGGGGGAGQSGNAYSGQAGGPGGNGTTNSITGSGVTYAGGGGGGCGQNNNSNGGAAGSGGGGRGGGGGPGTGSGSGGEPGTANTGGGGGGGGQCPQQGGNGGSGIVVIRYKFQN